MCQVKPRKKHTSEDLFYYQTCDQQHHKANVAIKSSENGKIISQKASIFTFVTGFSYFEAFNSVHFCSHFFLFIQTKYP